MSYSRDEFMARSAVCMLRRGFMRGIHAPFFAEDLT